MLFIALAMGLPAGITAQELSINSLQQIITADEDSLAELIRKSASLSQSLDQLNETIFRQKQNFKGSSNPIKRYNLNRNLKEAQQIAAELEAAGVRTRTIRHRLQENYHRIINQYEATLQETMRTTEKNDRNRSTASVLSLLDTLETNKKKYQQKLANQPFQKSEQPSLEIEPEDKLERLQLKNTLLQDRIARLRQEEQQLKYRLEDFQSNLSVYEELIIFTDNLQQIIDPEQEYFDQERMDQLKEEVHALKANISRSLERLQQIKTEKKSLEAKQAMFQKTIQNKLKKPKDGRSTDYE
ncbi:hypothetical protein KJ762_01340 [bacterium]|nr:hypothetical protein [bacterium]MBU1633132.1 hypothetical protein [bacterium]MBU1874451.1 hypothetical protein [bacterium]